MPTDGRNILSELFKAAGEGLARYGAEKGQQKAQQKQDLLTAFTATMQAQEAERARQQHALMMAQGQAALRKTDIQMKELLRRSNMTTEQIAVEDASAQQAAIEAVDNRRVASLGVLGPFNATPAGLGGAMQAGNFVLPEGSQLSFPSVGLTMKGLDPMAGAQAKAQLEYTRALADQAKAGADAKRAITDTPKNPLSVTERRFINQERESMAIAEANKVYESVFDSDEMSKIGISAITNVADLKKILTHLQKTGGRIKTNSFLGLDWLSADQTNQEVEGQLRGWLHVLQGKGYGPDKSFPTEQEYLDAKAAGYAE